MIALCIGSYTPFLAAKWGLGLVWPCLIYCMHLICNALRTLKACINLAEKRLQQFKAENNDGHDPHGELMQLLMTRKASYRCDFFLSDSYKLTVSQASKHYCISKHIRNSGFVTGNAPPRRQRLQHERWRCCCGGAGRGIQTPQSYTDRRGEADR